MTQAKVVTIEDVAVAVGVSKGTVSQALNGKGKLTPATRMAIERAAKRLGYRPNPVAKQLSSGRSDTVAIFTLHFDSGVALDKLRLIQSLLHKKKYEVPVYAYGFIDYTPDDQAGLMGALRRQRPLAIVCNTAGVHSDALRELQRYQDEGGCAVCYDYAVDLDCPSVVFDREDNTFQAARHLLDIGHRKIGLFLHGDPIAQYARVQGFRKALQAHGMDMRDDWIFNDGLHAEGGARMAAAVAAMKDRPTGVCVVNDVAASTFVNEVQRAGLRVPHDINVVSLDDTSLAQYCAVPLTAVSQPVEAIAHGVVDVLCRRLDSESGSGGDRGEIEKIVLKGELIRRASTSPR